VGGVTVDVQVAATDINCSQPLYLRTRKKKRARSARGWGLRAKRARRIERLLAHRLRGRVLYCSFLWQSTGNCLIKNFVTCLYLFTVIVLSQMKSFYCCTKRSKHKIPNFLMEATSDLIWILWTPPNAKQSFVSRSKTSLAWLQHSNYHRC